MTPQELKNSILQLAIQGKLVEQRPEEGTAEELYREIQAEKQQLIKTGKLKREKPLPEITEEEKPFEIPESWITIRLGSICQLLDGEKHTGEKYPYLEARYLRSIMPAQILEEGKFVSKGTHIILVDGENSGEVFQVPEAGYLGSTFKVLFIPQALCVEYVVYFLQYHRKKLRSSKKGAAIPHLNKDIFFNLILPLPPLAEQKRIVAKIEELLPYIDRYEQAWSRLEAFNQRFPDDMRKSILQLAIQGKLVEQRPEEGTGDELYREIQTEKQRLIKAGKIKAEKPLPEIAEDEKPFEIPESWKWVRWGDLSNSIQYGYNAPAQASGRIKMVRISDIQNGAVQWASVPYCDIEESEIANYLLMQNDILFARTGGTVGKSYLVKEVPEDAIYAGYLIRTQYSKQLSPQYLKYFMESQLYWMQLRSGTIATAQPNCNGKTLAKMILPLPPRAEQKRIVARLEELLAVCEKLKYSQT